MRVTWVAASSLALPMKSGESLRRPRRRPVLRMAINSLWSSRPDNRENSMNSAAGEAGTGLIEH